MAAVHAAAVISAATKFPYVEILSHSYFSTSLKFSAANAQCDKRGFISAKATKSEPGVNPKVGVAVYKPRSYEVLVTDAANCLFTALQDGKTRMEIDFPPLPTSISSYKGSLDDFSDANIQLAIAVIKKLQQKQETRACIVFPDKPEKRRASELFKAALDSFCEIFLL